MLKTRLHCIRSIAFMAGLLTIANITWAEDICREYSDVQGRIIKGQLIAYDAATKTVTIRREGSQHPQSVPLDRFCRADQQYIREWCFQHDFMDSLRITAELIEIEDRSRQPSYRLPYKPREVKALSYKVQLDNRSATRFGKVEIEYCLFYRQGEGMRNSMVFSDGVLCGRFTVNELEPNAKVDLTTDTVRVYEAIGPEYLSGQAGGAHGEAVGLWIRLHTTLSTGADIIREYCIPDHLRKSMAWTRNTIAAGLNRNEAEMPSN